MSIRLGFEGLGRAQLLAVARGGEDIVIDDEVVRRLSAQRAAIEEMVLEWHSGLRGIDRIRIVGDHLRGA